jgi:hypothetical protein
LNGFWKEKSHRKPTHEVPRTGLPTKYAIQHDFFLDEAEVDRDFRDLLADY